MMVVCTTYAQDLPIADIVISELSLFSPAISSKLGGSVSAITRQSNNDAFDYQSYYFNANKSFVNEKIGFSATVFQEKFNFISNSAALLNGSYFVELKKDLKMSFGLGVEFFDTNVKLNDVYVHDQGDPLLIALDQDLKMDFDAGLDLNWKRLSTGFGMYRLSSSAENYTMPKLMRGYLQYKLPARLGKDNVNIGLLYSDNSEDRVVAGFMQYWFFNDLYIGGSYGSNLSANFMLGYVYNDRIHFGYNYENQLSVNNFTSYHSVGVRLLLNEQYFDRRSIGKSMPGKSINIK